MAWKAPKLWSNSECWIIGGGSSVIEQFGIPDGVFKDVISGKLPMSACSPYMEEIHNKNVIGVNAAFKLGDWVKVMIFGDDGFYNKNKYDLAKFPNLKIACVSKKPTNKTYSEVGVKIIGRNNKREGLTANSKEIVWNHNSGAAAVNLAVHFGVKKIYLLGFDMNVGKSNRSHFHGHYGAKITNDKTFKRHLRCWSAIKRDANSMGIEIINVSPISQIQQFKRVSLNQVL